MKQLTQRNKLIICSVGIVVGIAIILCSIFLIDKGNSMPSTTNNSFGSSMPSGSSSMTPPSSSTGGQGSTQSPSSGTQSNQGPMNNNTTPSNMGSSNSVLKTVGIIIGSLILSLSLIYLIMSNIGKHNIFVTKDKVIIYILLNIIFVSCLTFGLNALTNKNTMSNNMVSAPTEDNQTTSDDSSSTTSESV